MLSHGRFGRRIVHVAGARQQKCREAITVPFSLAVAPNRRSPDLSSLAHALLAPWPQAHHPRVLNLCSSMLGVKGPLHMGPKSLEVNPCNLSLRKHGNWDLPLHTRALKSQV
jgi:hypothetical protein